MAAPLIVRPGRVWLRHVVPSPGASSTLLGKGMAATQDGLNGRQGWQNGEYSLRVSDDGDFKLTLPNTPGDDGRLHLDRFLAIVDKRYRIGDEWVEIWREQELMFVGSPSKPTATVPRLNFEGVDPVWLLRKQRDTAAAFHVAGPLDVFSHACSAWTVPIREDFTDGQPAMTASASQQTTADGRFTYINCASSTTGALMVFASGLPGKLDTVETLTVGSSAEPWRVEATMFGGTYKEIQVRQVSPSARLARLAVTSTSIEFDGVSYATYGAVVAGQSVTRLAIEGRGRWMFAYVDDRLIGVMPQPAGAVSATVRLWGAGTGKTVTLTSLLARQLAPYLRPTITDWRLPGNPPPSGLNATYVSIVDAANASRGVARALNPSQTPKAKRVEATLTHPFAMPPAWQPATVGNDNWASRHTGAIKLPLATTDIRVRAIHDDGIGIWIGKTGFSAAYARSWSSPGSTTTGAWLRTHLGQADTGWYPIIIEYFQAVGGGRLQVEYERADNPGVWNAIPSGDVQISPDGIVEQHSRLDSLWDLRRQVCETFGYQHRLRPKPLESGQFPGVLEVGIRVGRDTEKVLSSLDETVDSQQEIDATDVADTLLIDAAGLADPTQSGQLTYEAMNVGGLGEHVFLHGDQDTAADITDKALLEQRASSLAALRDSPWTQVSTRPAAVDEVIRDATWQDSIPIFGALARFAWEPGDGLRIKLPQIAVDDQTPRQIMGVTWPVFPDGHGGPTVAFRQRPRGLRETWYRLIRKQSAQASHYQGQLTKVPGSIGYSGTSTYADAYSRLLLPEDLATVVEVKLTVWNKTDTSVKAVEVNGSASSLTLAANGFYDVTDLAAYYGISQALMYARLTGGTGDQFIQLIATVLI